MRQLNPAEAGADLALSGPFVIHADCLIAMLLPMTLRRMQMKRRARPSVDSVRKPVGEVEVGRGGTGPLHTTVSV